MLHPDYQYTPKLIPAIVCMMAFEQYDAVLASRMLGNSALKGGMPFYKFVANKFLTGFENILTGEKLSEYHTGFRGFTRKVLENLPLAECDDDFIFDNQMIALLFYNNYKIGELSLPDKVLQRSILYQLCALLQIRFWRTWNKHSIQIGKNRYKIQNLPSKCPKTRLIHRCGVLFSITLRLILDFDGIIIRDFPTVVLNICSTQILVVVVAAPCWFDRIIFKSL